MDDQQKAGLRRLVLAKHRVWIEENAYRSLGDLASEFPNDPDVTALLQAMGRLYKLYYLIEQAEERS